MLTLFIFLETIFFIKLAHLTKVIFEIFFNLITAAEVPASNNLTFMHDSKHYTQLFHLASYATSYANYAT